MKPNVKRTYAVFSVTALSLLSCVVVAFAAAGDVPLLNSVITLIVRIVQFAGGIWLLWGVIVLASALKDHNSPQMQSGIWQIVGGALILLASSLFSSLAL